MKKSDQWVSFVTIGILAFTTLFLASGPRWVVCISSFMVMFALVPLAGSKRYISVSDPLLLCIGVPLFFTGFQLLPLPSSLIEVIAPGRFLLAKENAQIYQQAMPSWISVSQDWPATLVELVKFSGYFGFAYLCSRLCVSKTVRSRLFKTIALIGLTVAICALGHRLVGAKSLLGLYTPTVSYAESISPFFNPNHLSGYMAFVTPLCMGLAWRKKSWLWCLAVLVCGFTGIQANSRAGLISLVVGVVIFLFGATAMAKRKGRTTHKFRQGYAPVIAFSLVFIGLLVFTARAGSQLLDLDLHQEQEVGKFQAWLNAPDMLEGSQLFGIGRGAFENSFPLVQPPTGMTYSHIENEYIQTVLDWGWIPVLFMMFALLWLFRKYRERGIRGIQSLAALAAVVSLLVHNMADFNLELPGIVFPAIALLAIIRPGNLIVEKQKNKQKRNTGIRLVALGIGTIFCALALSSLGQKVKLDIAHSNPLKRLNDGPSEEVLKAAHQISLRHSSSYWVPAKAAHVLWKKRDVRAFSVLARVLELNPNHFGVHFLAAKILAQSQQQEQAIGEYRLALAIPGGSKRTILKSLMAHFPKSEDAVSALPQDLALIVRYGGELIDLGRPDIAEALVRRSLLLGESSFEVVTLGVKSAFKGNLPWALRISEEQYRKAKDEKSLLLYLSVLDLSSLPLIGIKVVQEYYGHKNISNISILDMMATFHVSNMDVSQAKIYSQKIIDLGHSNPKWLSKSHKRLEKIETMAGNRHQAKWHKEQAQRLDTY